MNLTFDQEQRRLVGAFARRVQTRLMRACVRGVDYEDIFQELCIAWCKARDCFDPNAGVPFTPYMQLGLRNHINRWAEKELGFTYLANRSLDAETAGEHSLHEAVPDEAISPEDQALAADHRRRIEARLSEQARLFLTLLESPPDFLVEAVSAGQARAIYARSRGLASTAPGRVTAAMIFDFMGANRVTRNKINAELKSLCRQPHGKS